MSELSRRLQQPGDPLLSALFTYGIAGETFQENVLQHLNFVDRQNLRASHPRLNEIFKGRPIVVTYRNSSGRIEVSLDAQGNPTMSNSTAHWLRGVCHGMIIPAWTPCGTTPRMNV